MASTSMRNRSLTKVRHSQRYFEKNPACSLFSEFVMSGILKIDLSPLPDEEVKYEPIYNYKPPMATSKVYPTSILGSKLLTTGEDVKDIYEVIFNVMDIENIEDYIPGDAISILPKNYEHEVDEIFKMLQLKDQQYKLSFQPNVKLDKVKHLPKEGTLKNLFLYHIEVKAVPQKLFIKKLIPFIKNEDESDYIKSIINDLPYGYSNFMSKLEEKSLLSLLKTIPSCQPPIELLLEQLPAIKPRCYSIISSPLNTPFIKIIFSVQSKNVGVCSGWLKKLVENRDKLTPIPFYFRKSNRFLDIGDNTEVILVAVGTAIAPFLWFLQERSLNNITDKTSLFYGCRYSTRDFIYQRELENYVDGKTLNLYKTFSREGYKHHIQDLMRSFAKDIGTKLMNSNASVCICGSDSFIKSIEDTIKYCLSNLSDVPTSCNRDENQALEIFMDLKKSGRIRADTWC